MKKRTKLLIVVACIIGIATTLSVVIFAAPTVTLTSSQDGNVADLKWVNSDNIALYNYRVMKSINDGDFNGLSAENTSQIKVLNVYPDSGDNITFTTYDGENVTVQKAGSLKQWMEQPTSEDSRGYGRGLIEVTPLKITDFNANPSAYLYKQADGKYNYDVVFFGAWDCNGARDLTTTSASVVESYINSGNGVIFGHDTLALISGSNELYHPNFASLAKYVNITTATSWTDNRINKVYISKTGIFTTYPWSIGTEGTRLTIPTAHNLGQTANGDIWLKFDNTILSGNQNFYLTTYNNCAMIQTGHSSGAATADEQKIFANLIFYLADLSMDTSAQDTNFVDINAPDAPTIKSKDLNGTSGSITYEAEDNGTKYKYYVEATEKTSQVKTSSNTVTEIRKTGVAGYSYVIDNKEDTEPDNTIDTTSTTINYTLGNGPKTYLHIKTIDGAGNVSGVTHVLLHENVAPTLELSQSPTEWTNGNVTITATAADTDGSVVSIKKPDGTVENVASTTYEVEQNGTYEFIATDNSGATTTKTIEITNIDKVPPQGTPSVEQPTSKRRTAKITLKATDNESGVAKIILPDGTEVTSTTAEYEVTVPDTYTFKVIDVAGNETVVDVPVTIVSDGLEVKYIDQVTKDEIADSTPITGNVGDDYTTSAKTIDGYTLVVTPQNKDGKLTMDKITVTYEYRKLSNVVVKYIDENTGAEIPGVDEITTTYKEGDSYTTEKKTIDGYTFTKDTQNLSGTIARENIEVVYYYKKTSKGVLTRYIDQVTKQEIADSQSQTGLENDNYTTTPATVNGYELVLTPDNAKGKMTVGQIIVTYEYRKLSNVVVKYIDENTGVEIPSVDEITTTYKEGDSYTTEKKDIPNYTYTKDTKNLSGTVARENIEVVYYYKKTSQGVVTRHIDQVTKDEIAKSTTQTGLENDDYTTSSVTINGYVLVLTPANATGKMTPDQITVTYEYRKLSNVTVKYIDENTGKEIPGVDEITTTYKEGDPYTTELKDITGYTYTKDTDNTRGTVERENIEVIYYYKKTSQGVVTRYIDQVTKQEIADSESQTGLENDEYTTTPAKVDGYELVLTPTNANGKMTPELITVTYEYRKLSNVVVKYIDENTGVEIPSVDEITTTYKEGDSYTTEKKDIPNYTYTKDTKNLSGTVGRENIEVVYYYKKTSQGVVTKYIDQVTKEEIAPSQSQTGLENDDYTTTPAVVKGYELVLTPDNAKGKMTPAQITVTYEYRKLSDVTVKYIDENTGAEIPGVDEITTTYKQGERYTTEKKTIDGYTYTKDTNNTSGVVERMNIEVVYYYKKTSGGVLTKYIDQVTKKEIAASKHQAGLENDDYTTSAVVVEGYELVLTPANATGKMTPEQITVTYEYRKQSNVTVKYVDENTGKELLGQVTTTYKQGDPYTTEKKAIDGYTYTKDTGNVSGTVERENIEVVYYYKRNTKVVVKYIDEVTKEEIIDSVEITGLEKDPYETEEKEKAGYELVGVDGNTTGKMTVDPIEVTYKYRKNANLITKHIDKNSGEKIVEDVVKKYKEGDKYEALPQNIAGYVLVESPEETTGTMGRENVEKTFYYKKISEGLVVKYVDKITGELLDIEEYTGNENDLITFDEKTFLHYVIYSRPDVSESRLTPGAQEYTYYYVREAQVKIKGINQDTQEVLYETTISGLEGNEYTTEPRIIDGCELVKVPENKNGIYSRNSKDVIYEYKQLSRGVTVRYIDKDTQEEIADEEKITGYVGDTYQTEKKTFEKYNFVEVKGDEIGSLEAEEKEVTYYYEKKTGEVEVVYVDENGEELLKESLTGKVDEEYKVVAKTIKNYRIKEVVGEEEGVYELDKIIVKYVMEKIPGRVIVNLLDGDGNVLDRIEKDGFVGEKLKIDLPEKEGYYIKGDKTIEVDYEEGEIVINVEYIKIEPAPETGDINVLVYALIFIVSGTAIVVAKKHFSRK